MVVKMCIVNIGLCILLLLMLADGEPGDNVEEEDRDGRAKEVVIATNMKRRTVKARKAYPKV